MSYLECTVRYGIAIVTHNYDALPSAPSLLTDFTTGNFTIPGTPPDSPWALVPGATAGTDLTVAAVTTDTTLTVTTTSGMTIDDKVGVELDTGDWFWARIANLIGNDVVFDDGLPSGAAIGNRVAVVGQLDSTTDFTLEENFKLIKANSIIARTGQLQTNYIVHEDKEFQLSNDVLGDTGGFFASAKEPTKFTLETADGLGYTFSDYDDLNTLTDLLGEAHSTIISDQASLIDDIVNAANSQAAMDAIVDSRTPPTPTGSGTLQPFVQYDDSNRDSITLDGNLVLYSLMTPFGGFGHYQNLLKWSEDLTNAVWTQPGSRVTVTGNTTIAPNRETTADTVQWDLIGLGLRQAVTVVESSVYTVSFWAIHISGNDTLSFDLGDGGVSQATIESNNIMRYSVSLTAGANNWFDISSSGSAGTYVLWGFDLSLGTDVLPYAKTEAFALTTADYGLSVAGNLRTDFTEIVSESSGALNTFRVKSGTFGSYIVLSDGSDFDNITIECYEDGTQSNISLDASTKSEIRSGSTAFEIKSNSNSVDLITGGNDTKPPITIEAEGTNGAKIQLFASTRSPIGNVTGEPGDNFNIKSGVASASYTHKGASANNTDWERNATINSEEGLIFTPSAAPTYARGQVYYDDTDDSLSYQTGSTGVTNNIGKEIFVPPKVKNDQGSPITNGQAVYVSGSDGTYPEVKLAQANAAATAASVGLITETSIADGSPGYCTTYGLVRGFNTVAWAAGDTLYLSPTVAGGLQNTAPIYPNKAIRMGIVISSAASGTIWVTYPTEEIASGSALVYKSHALSDQGAADVAYLAGFYEAPTTDVTLTIGGTVTQTYGTVLGSHAAHIFCVASGAGGTDLVLTVTGISINDAGVRNDSDSEILVADTDAAIIDQYFESSKKWLGVATMTLSGAAGSFTFNYGFCKYDDYGNQAFTVTDFEMVNKSGVAATAQNIELLHHKATNWTYAATGFVPGTSDTIISMADDYGVNTSIFTDKYFPYKRSGLSQVVDGTANEGIIVRVTQSTNNSTDFGTAHIGVRA